MGEGQTLGAARGAQAVVLRAGGGREREGERGREDC